MGVLKNLTDEYFGKNMRAEDLIDISDLDVEIVSFTDNNGNYHSHGYRVKGGGENERAKTLRELTERIIEIRGNECDLNDIDVSNITSMNYEKKPYGGEYDSVGVFQGSYFNGDISGWNVSNVKVMERMFYCAKKFNKPIGKWDVRKVYNMISMFHNATSFNQDLSKWELKDGHIITEKMFMCCPINNDKKPNFKK